MITQDDLLKSLPDVISTKKFKNLSKNVEIFRDKWGIPHIKANSEKDLFFAQGFVTAQDRLWHMDYDRHRGLGRWSEWAGQVNESNLSQDILMRKLSLERASKADYEVSRPDTKLMVDSLTEGINAYINDTENLPIEYQLLGEKPELWEPWHSFLVYKCRNMLMGTFDMKLWRARLVKSIGPKRASELFRGYPYNHLVTTPPGIKHKGENYTPYEELAYAWSELNNINELDSGSNAWVVSGDKTVSGLPLVAGDSHRGLDTPSVYYQIHLSCSDWRISGYSLPGVPGAPHFSHNEYVGFGMTHGVADYQDLFIEKFRERSGKLEYSYKNGWYPADVREEEITIKDGKPIPIEVVITRHGRIVAGNPREGIGLAFSHTGTNQGTKWMDSVLDISRCKNADELEDAVKEWTEPVNNYMYCDVYGEFGYRLRGRIPIRDIRNTWVPVSGSDGNHEWEREIPWDEMPQVRNPEIGYAVTCNQKVTTDDYKYHINHYFGNGWRAERIVNRINQIDKGDMDINKMGSIHADSISIPGIWIADKILSLNLEDYIEKEFQKLLVNWNGDMDKNRIEPTIVAETYMQLSKIISDHIFVKLSNEALLGKSRGAPGHFGEVMGHVLENMNKNKQDSNIGIFNWDELIRNSFIEAIIYLKKRLGNDTSKWIWGRVHTTNPVHPLSEVFPDIKSLLDPPKFALSGGMDTPLAGTFSYANRFYIDGLSVNRYIHDPSDWTKSKWVVPLGSSGHPGSVHYSDQGELHSNIEYVPQLWEWEDIKDNSESIQLLKPR